MGKTSVETTVERSIWINAPQERVWAAVAEPTEMGQWFLPPALGAQLERDANGKLRVMMGPMGIDFAQVESSNPPHKLTTRGLPDNRIATTYAFEPENNGTRVTISMSGFDAFPQETAHERMVPSGAAWDQALQNLKAYVEGAPLPYPQGFITALFGYRRESPKQAAIERSIWIAAPRERVWQAISDPAQMQKWFSPNTPWRGKGGLQVGATFSVYDAATDSDLYTQKIERVDAPRELVTRSLPTPPEPSYVTQWVLEPDKNGTRLSLSFFAYEYTPTDAQSQTMEQHAFGFGMMLQNLKASVEDEPLPFPGGF